MSHLKIYIVKSVQRVKYIIPLCLLFLCLKGKAENFFTRPLKDNGVHFLIETGVGHSHYSSSGKLYKLNQSVFHGSGILGYDIKSLFMGIGGTVSMHTKEHIYSFRAFIDARYKLNNILMEPYGEILGGVVGYLKWNDFIKPYYAFGTGIHILPRLSTGLRVSRVGTLDNQSATEWSFNISLKF